MRFSVLRWAAILFAVLAGCGGHRYPDEVRAIVDRAADSLNRMSQLQFEMTERIHSGGLEGDEVNSYQQGIQIAEVEYRAACAELEVAADEHGLSIFALLDEVSARTAAHTRNLRKKYPKASRAMPESK